MDHSTDIAKAERIAVVAKAQDVLRRNGSRRICGKKGTPPRRMNLEAVEQRRRVSAR
jgi:hypothetical protein